MKINYIVPIMFVGLMSLTSQIAVATDQGYWGSENRRIATTFDTGSLNYSDQRSAEEALGVYNKIVSLRSNIEGETCIDPLKTVVQKSIPMFGHMSRLSSEAKARLSSQQIEVYEIMMLAHTKMSEIFLSQGETLQAAYEEDLKGLAADFSMVLRLESAKILSQPLDNSQTSWLDDMSKIAIASYTNASKLYIDANRIDKAQATLQKITLESSALPGIDIYKQRIQLGQWLLTPVDFNTSGGL